MQNVELIFHWSKVLIAPVMDLHDPVTFWEIMTCFKDTKSFIGFRSSKEPEEMRLAFLFLVRKAVKSHCNYLKFLTFCLFIKLPGYFSFIMAE